MTKLTVWRGGGGGKPSLTFAHTDRAVAEEYGKVCRMVIDTSEYLDARTPEGKAEYARIVAADPAGYTYEVEAIAEAGYAGAIYEDTGHDWDFEIDGHEIAIFDETTILEVRW